MSESNWIFFLVSFIVSMVVYEIAYRNGKRFQSDHCAWLIRQIWANKDDAWALRQLGFERDENGNLATIQKP